MTSTVTTSTTRTAPPPAALGASGLALLAACVGGYGSVYFTGQEGWTDLGVTFVTAYLFLSALGAASAVALLLGRTAGRYGLMAFGVWMAVFTTLKLVAFQETEAIVFGVVGLVVLGLASRPSVRLYVGAVR
jgi:hypothetical protein